MRPRSAQVATRRSPKRGKGWGAGVSRRGAHVPGRLGDGSLPLGLERHLVRAPEPPHGCRGAGVGAGQPQAQELVQQLVARGGALRQVDAGEAGQGSGAKRGTHCCCGCWQGTGSEEGKAVTGPGFVAEGSANRGTGCGCGCSWGTGRGGAAPSG